MTGYQEILTDPSYTKQIVTLTYPHIGNTGINDQDGAPRITPRLMGEMMMRIDRNAGLDAKRNGLPHVGGHDDVASDGTDQENTALGGIFGALLMALTLPLLALERLTFRFVEAGFSVLTATFGLLVAALGRTPEATRGLAILAGIPVRRRG